MDVGASFCLSEASVGTPRAAASVGPLSELNPYVAVSVLPEPAVEDAVLRRFSVVVATNASFADATRWDAVCRSQSPAIPFIQAEVLGAAGFVFSDFGPAHTIRRPDPDPPLLHGIEGIECLAEKRRLLVKLDPTKCCRFEKDSWVCLRRACDPPHSRGTPLRVCERRAESVQLELHAGVDAGTDWVAEYGKGGFVEELQPAALARARSTPITAVSADEATGTLTVTCGGGVFHDIQAGERVVLSAAGVAPSPALSVTAVDADRLSLPLAVHPDLAARFVGGWVEPLPPAAAHRPLPEALSAAALAGWDSEDRPACSDLALGEHVQQLHAGVVGLQAYRAAHGTLPPLHDTAAAAEVVESTRAWASRLKEGGEAAESLVDEALVSRLARTAAAEFPALCAYFGGVAAHEVAKATGTHTPLRQWLYLDTHGALLGKGEERAGADSESGAAAAGGGSGGEDAPAADEFAPLGSRYDGTIAILGRTLHAKVMQQRVLVAGAGAVGSELLKGLAQLGMGTDEGGRGKVTVADLTHVGVGDLGHGFGFRAEHAGLPKSATAATAACALNPGMRVEVLAVADDAETGPLAGHSLWEGVDAAVNTLAATRECLDALSVQYGKPLLDCKAQGVTGSNEVAVPHQTLTIGQTRDADQWGEWGPGFPHALYPPEGIVAWAIRQFDAAFVTAQRDAAALLAAPEAWLRELQHEPAALARRRRLENVLQALGVAEARSLDCCIRNARRAFHTLFYLPACALAARLPPDGVDPEYGTTRTPTVGEFTLADATYHAFIVHHAALAAANHGIALPEGWDTPAALSPALAAVEPTLIAPNEAVAPGPGTDGDAGSSEADAAACAALTAELQAKAAALDPDRRAALAFRATGFDHTGDSQRHVSFVHAASSLWRRSRGGPPLSYWAVKQLALHTGLLRWTDLAHPAPVPALASACAGLLCIELCKLATGAPAPAMRSSFLNLAINAHCIFQPAEPKRVRSTAYHPVYLGPTRAQPEGFTLWDRIMVKEGDLTLDQLRAWLKEHQKINVVAISSGRHNLYLPFMKPALRASRGASTVRAAYEDAARTPLPDGKPFLMLQVDAEEESGDVEIPAIQFFFA